MAELTKSVKGSLLFFIDGIGQRLVGIISTLILARILVPADFGIVAIATVTLNLMEVLSKNFSGQRIEAANNNEIVNLDVIFSINLIQKIVLCTLVFILTPYIAEFLSEPKLKNVFYVVTFTILITGFTNPGIYLLKKNQEYVKLVSVSFLSKVISVIITLYIALKFKSFWALVIGQSISYILPVIGGYLVYRYRPRLCFNRAYIEVRYTLLSLPNEMFGYVRSQFDIMFVAKLFNSSYVGGYHMMKYYSMMPMHYFIMPLFETLIVQLGSVRSNYSYYSVMYNVSQLSFLLLSVPITVYIVINSEDIVNIILGKQWVIYSDLFALLSLSSFFISAAAFTSKVLILENKLKILLFFNLASFLSFIVLIAVYITFYIKPDLVEFIKIKLAVEIFHYIVIVLYVYNSIFSLDNLKKFLIYIFITVTISILIAFSCNSIVVPDRVFGLIINCILYVLFFYSTFLLFNYLLFKKAEENAYLYYKMISFKDFLNKRLK